MSDSKMDALPSLQKEANEESRSQSEVSSSTHSKHAKGSENSKGKHSRSRSSDWKIMEGLRENQRCDYKPEMYEGYMMKRRKWPLKGWHKRLFVLDQGILTYAKTPSEIARGKVYGTIDIGLSVVSTKASRRRIDIDDEEFIYHLRVKKYPSNPNLKFDEWVSHLCHHRLYRQHELQYGTRDAPKMTSPIEEIPLNFTPDSTSIRRKALLRENSSVTHTPPILGRQATHQGRVAAWVFDGNSLEQCNKDLSNIQQNIFNLRTVLEKLECISIQSSDNLELVELNNFKKDRRKFMLKKMKKKNRNSEVIKSNRMSFTDIQDKIMTASSEDISISVANNQGSLEVDDLKSDLAKLSLSNPLLSNNNVDSDLSSIINNKQSANQANNCPQIAIQDRSHQLSNEFLNGAKEVHSNLRSMLRTIQNERDRLRQALEKEISAQNGVTSPPHTVITTLKASLSQVLQQNADLRARLGQIHAASDLGEGIQTPPTPVQQSNLISTAYECNSVLSSSDYYDATENLSVSDSSSEASLSEEDYEEESAISELSDIDSDFITKQPDKEGTNGSELCTTGRRSKLPATKPETGDFSLWNLLCKNIGKDLSKVSMPVTLNEPLNALQRLCEELEYSDLLDKASILEDPVERMMYMAAFAVSAYGSTNYRAGHKPFNPLLGETYECVREDKGFKFISEQVSHHPPVSACHAESDNFLFWQDIRIKTKFWGKSMEIQPLGTVHVVLPRWNEHYKWNKVTSCVHNIFSGQRWVDQYGEMIISKVSGDVKCKLTFLKASYWSNKCHEVQGSISSFVDGVNVVKHSLFGKWNEALYCGVNPSARCIWRPGAMPEDYELYYGFSRFAIELNELTPEMLKSLPPTDTRLRPDQRLLEEGDVNGAEAAKLQIEQSQRERRKRREQTNIVYEPMWFRKMKDEDGEHWKFNHQYWTKRQNLGFCKVTFPLTLW